MVLDIFGHLWMTIGMVFFLLSTMSIFWQILLTKSTLTEKDNPYSLFAVSNAGAFLALISYPFLFELFLDLNAQQNIWRLLYFFLVLLQGLSLYLIPVKQEPSAPSKKASPVSFTLKIIWMLYAASSVIFFMATTNMATSEIAPMPLLWIIPLGLYLLSFVLNFKKNPFCPAWLKRNPAILMACSVFFYFSAKEVSSRSFRRFSFYLSSPF